MYWLFDEDVYNNHGDIDGNKKALLKREIQKWSFILRWVIRLGSRSPNLLLLCMSTTPLERKNEGPGQNSFHPRWSKITFQLLVCAHCINIQCSKWHCAVSNSPAFCDKGPPIMIHAMIHFSKYCQWASIYCWTCLALSGMLWGTCIHQFLRGTQSGHVPSWNCAHPHTRLREKFHGEHRLWRGGWISVWADRIKSVPCKRKTKLEYFVVVLLNHLQTPHFTWLDWEGSFVFSGICTHCL